MKDRVEVLFDEIKESLMKIRDICYKDLENLKKDKKEKQLGDLRGISYDTIEKLKKAKDFLKKRGNIK